MDCFEVNIKGNRQEHVVSADHYWDFFENKKLSKTTSETIIIFAKEQFSRHGIPFKVITDGAAYFVSEKFQDFRKNGYSDKRRQHQIISEPTAKQNQQSKKQKRLSKGRQQMDQMKN